MNQNEPVAARKPLRPNRLRFREILFDPSSTPPPQWILPGKGLRIGTAGMALHRRAHRGRHAHPARRENLPRDALEFGPEPVAVFALEHLDLRQRLQVLLRVFPFELQPLRREPPVPPIPGTG